MDIITKDDIKLAVKFSIAEITEGLNFFSDENDFLQIGSWRYAKGKELAAHNHNIVERKINRTQEFVFVARGSLKAFIYDEKDQLVDKIEVNAQEGLILYAGGHGYEILADDTVVIETKNGPYPGADVDRRRL